MLTRDPPATQQHDDENEEKELSKEEEAAQRSKQAVADAEARTKEANDKLAEAITTMDQKFTCYKSYWLEGLATNITELHTIAELGVPVRAVIWGHVAPPPPPEAEGAEGAPPADAAAPPEVAQPQPPVPPELWSAVKEASAGAGWGHVLGDIVPMEIELPPSPMPGKT